VYVSDDLKRRMDKAKSVTWSHVACEAFERKLGELVAHKQEKKMEDVIQRLRASKLEGDSEAKQGGREAGREWATHTAEAGELTRLERYVKDCREVDPFIMTEDDGYRGAHVFVHVVVPEAKDDRDLMRETLEILFDTAGQDEPPMDEFVQGFADGALDVWGEVKDKI